MIEVVVGLTDSEVYAILSRLMTGEKQQGSGTSSSSRLVCSFNSAFLCDEEPTKEKHPESRQMCLVQISPLKVMHHNMPMWVKVLTGYKKFTSSGICNKLQYT